MKVSVCIATWCRKEKLKEIILLLENQSMKRNEYEIIVVDSFSYDGTKMVMKDLCKQYENIVYIEDAVNVLAAKRNVGIENAKSEIIVFLDDDVYPSYDFVEAHYNANKNNEDTFFCGQIRFPQELCKKSNYYRFRDCQHLSSKDVGKNLEFNKIVVMNLSFKKKFISNVGKVDERFIGYGCEDIEFGYRVKKYGYKIKYLEEAKAIHKEDSSDIVSYGVKLYKSGLYGDRTLKKICPELEKAITLPRMFGFLLSTKIVSSILSKILLRNDCNPHKYCYLLYKVYIYSRFYKGKRDQKKYQELNVNMIKKGW